MKKYKLLCIGLLSMLFSNVAIAQNTISEIYTYPAAFLPNEEVELYFDVSGTNLDGESGPLYLWTWNPGDPAKGNGSWDNSADHMMLEQVEGNLWKFTMTPTTFYGVSADKVTEIYGLLKTKDGSKQTDDFKAENGNAIVLYDFSTMAAKIMDWYPQDFRGDRPLSIIVNTALTSPQDASNSLKGTDKVFIHTGVNGWGNVVDYNSTSKNTALTKIGEDLWRFDLIPQDFYGSTDAIKEINFVFNNGSWDKEGKDTGGVDFKIVPTKPGSSEPEYRIFPGKFTLDDVVTIYFNQQRTKVEGLKFASEVHFSLSTDLEETFEGVTRHLENGRFSFTFIPARTFDNTEDVSSMTLIFKTVDGTEATEEIMIDETYIVK